jgi:hypothetical protein
MKIADMWTDTSCIFESWLGSDEHSLTVRLAFRDSGGKEITETQFVIRALGDILYIEHPGAQVFILTMPTRDSCKKRVMQKGKLAIKLMIETTMAVCFIEEEVETTLLKWGAKGKENSDEDEDEETKTEVYKAHKTRITMTPADGREFLKVLRGISELGEKARKAVEGNKKRGRKAKGGEK